MENLITIETVPIQVEFVEKKPLQVSATQNLAAKTAPQPEKKQIKLKPIHIDVRDRFEPSSNYNWKNSSYKATAKMGEDGNLKLNIQMEDGEARAIRFKHINRSIESMSSQANAGTVQAGNFEISIPLADLASGMPEVDNFTNEFIPPDLQLVVTQRPEVIIKYVGGPIYVPPSSDPNYNPPLGFEPAQVGNDKILDEKV